MAKIIGHDGSDLAAAAASLQAGRLVAFPTETVYGLGANALDAAASSRIFEVKGRPASDPLIVHVLGWAGAQQLIGDVTPAQRELARAVTDKLWPGPLTVVLPAADVVPSLITAQTGWVGIRSPAHPVARKLIAASGLCLAAPSANRFNHVSPTQPQHVMQDLGARDDSLLVLDGGASNIGIESTVVKVHPDRLEVRFFCSQVKNCTHTHTHTQVLRRGAISPSDLASALAGHATLASTPITERDTMSRPKAVIEEMEGPGQMVSSPPSSHASIVSLPHSRTSTPPPLPSPTTAHALRPEHPGVPARLLHRGRRLRRRQRRGRGAVRAARRRGHRLRGPRAAAGGGVHGVRRPERGRRRRRGRGTAVRAAAVVGDGGGCEGGAHPEPVGRAVRRVAPGGAAARRAGQAVPGRVGH